MNVYYNEFDPKAAEWLRQLMADGLIPDGVVDERDIRQVEPEDVAGFDQCHFFAGIGGWPLSLWLAEWGERKVWTGSCPCQPFSVAGKRKGEADERHLWPDFWRLIALCEPPVVVGEQVARKAGRVWLAGVRSDLEGLGYAVGAADLCAAGTGAPHIRQRLYWMAHACKRASERDAGGFPAAQAGVSGQGQHDGHLPVGPSDGGDRCSGWMGDSPGGGLGTDGNAPGSAGYPEQCIQDVADGLVQSFQSGLEGHAGNVANGNEPGRVGENPSGPVAPAGNSGGMGQPPVGRDGQAPLRGSNCPSEAEGRERGGGGSSSLGFWSNSRIILCRDNKYRRIPLEPSLFPLAARLPGRVGLLRGAGNAICVPLATEFLEACKEVIGD